MPAILEQVIKDIRNLSHNERALVAHCLIVSLEEKHDNWVDQAWGDLAKQRLSELESGEIKGISWSEIKNTIKRKNA